MAGERHLGMKSEHVCLFCVDFANIAVCYGHYRRLDSTYVVMLSYYVLICVVGWGITKLVKGGKKDTPAPPPPASKGH